MPLQIWKFELEQNKPYPSVDMPEGAEVIHAKEYGNKIYVFAKVDTKSKLKARFFEVYNTGENMVKACKRKYIGTVHIWHSKEELKWKHVFEIIG